MQTAGESENVPAESGGWDIAEPRPDALIESLRAFGYSPETAVADLLDNSISAGAKNIDVVFYWSGEGSFVSVQDDGRGMSEAKLVSAMRPGSSNPLDDRSDSDLGRFGLGLKTASFSQARELTVATRQAGGQTSIRRWDLDVVATTREWRLLRSPPSDVEIADPPRRQGTLVVWSKCDRLVGAAATDDSKAQTRFNQATKRVGDHLGVVFHRFLSGRGKVTLRINGVPIEPWDPFMESHPATQPMDSENLPLAGRTVRVTPFVLPHRSKLEPREHSLGAGISGWNQQQGFYIYRNDRLLVQGDWLGLGMSKDEHTKLARIRVDFPASLDQVWQVDVKKSSTQVPGALHADLRRIAQATRSQAEKVYRHRGQILARRHAQDFVMAWQQYRTRDGETRYRLNRSHPAIRSLFEASGVRKSVIERGLRFVEETIPTTLIGVSIASSLDEQPRPFSTAQQDLQPLLQLMFDSMTATGISSDEALERIGAAEPLNHYPELLQAFREKIQ